MKIDVTNLPRSAAKYRNVILSASNFYASMLMHKNLLDNIELIINFMKLELGDAPNVASSIWNDDNYRPREFTITLAAFSEINEVLLLLAHEMVHVKQWARGETKDYVAGPRFRRFNGILYDTDVIDYWDLPWEIEAYGRERGLYIRYCEYVEAEKNDKEKSYSKIVARS